MEKKALYLLCKTKYFENKMIATIKRGQNE
jgi:hypothetical protein